MFSSTPWKCPSAATRPTSSDLIYLFKVEIEESGRAVTFQSIHQCKGQFPLETGVIPTEP